MGSGQTGLTSTSFRGNKKCILRDSRNTPSTTNLEEEEIVDAPGNDGNASVPEQVKRPNPWRRRLMMMMMMMMMMIILNGLVG